MDHNIELSYGDTVKVTYNYSGIDDEWWLTDYTPTHFITEEFVDPDTFAVRGKDSLGCMDVRMLITADAIREYFNKSMTINNWKWGGNRKWSGLRTTKSPDYITYSQHTFGRAIDFIMKDISAQEIRDEIKSHQDHPAFRFITAIEDFPEMNWCHVDCRIWKKNEKGIMIFSK